MSRHHLPLLEVPPEKQEQVSGQLSKAMTHPRLLTCKKMGTLVLQPQDSEFHQQPECTWKWGHFHSLEKGRSSCQPSMSACEAGTRGPTETHLTQTPDLRPCRQQCVRLQASAFMVTFHSSNRKPTEMTIYDLCDLSRK